MTGQLLQQRASLLPEQRTGSSDAYQRVWSHQLQPSELGAIGGTGTAQSLHFADPILRPHKEATLVSVLKSSAQKRSSGRYLRCSRAMTNTHHLTLKPVLSTPHIPGVIVLQDFHHFASYPKAHLFCSHLGRYP